MVELIAQSFAAVKGYADLQEGKPVRKGFLVGVKRFTFQGTAYGGDRLLIYITKTGETDEFALAEGRVIRGEEVLAFGNLMVWIPEGGLMLHQKILSFSFSFFSWLCFAPSVRRQR